MTSTVFAAVHEPVEDAQEMGGVFEREAGGGLVEDVERFAGGAAREFGCEFDALRLASADGGRGLSEPDVAQPDGLQRFEFGLDAGDVGEQRVRFGDGHLQHVGDALAAKADLEGVLVVAPAVAHLRKGR